MLYMFLKPKIKHYLYSKYSNFLTILSSFIIMRYLENIVLRANASLQTPGDLDVSDKKSSDFKEV